LRRAACSCSLAAERRLLQKPAASAAASSMQQVSPLTAFPSFRIASLRRIIAEKTSNRFNESRAHEIGPDLAALEWLMECGATQVEMSDGRRIGSQKEMRAYVREKMEWKLSSSPSTSSSSSSPTSPSSSPHVLSHGDIAFAKQWPNAPRGVYIVSVDASDSAIANEGFKYLKEVRQLRKLKLNFCDYFGDEALRELAGGRTAKTIEDIEIVLNPSMSDGAAYWLTKLTALRRAHFYFLPYVANRPAFIRALKLALPRCTVTFPEVGNIGYGYDEKDVDGSKKK
ncbi:hypothetical protein PFISCL1PPCAC_3829, partial [Pristionchus fissidentatus]